MTSNNISKNVVGIKVVFNPRYTNDRTKTYLYQGHSYFYTFTFCF